MRIGRMIFKLLFLAFILVYTGCGDADEPQAGADPAAFEQGGGMALDVQPASPEAEENVNQWLEQVRSGAVPGDDIADAANRNESFDWALGYLTYYGPLDTLGVDNLIYNALRAHVRLATGEVDEASMSDHDRNLVQITDGIQLDRDVAPEAQTAQTPEVRQAILERISQTQRHLTPEEALASNEVIGVLGSRPPAELGTRYLVYGQESPGAEFEFLGLVIVADVAPQGSPTIHEAYSFGDWQGLPWLGDAAGPFWNEVPAGASGDPTNTAEGRPGVLLVNERHYEAIKAGDY